MAADPAQRTVLFLKANPASTLALDLEAEYQAIAQSLGRAAKHHTLRVVAEGAVTDDDLRRALLDREPEIVHFSGHGAGRRGLVFEDAGEPLFISGDALAGLLGLCSKHVKCVVLNACYSDVQAKSISSVVECVIGMSRAIGDAAAIKFSTGFYDAIAAGRSFTDSFHFGCNAISLKGIPESFTPTLIVKHAVQSKESVTDAKANRTGSGASVRKSAKALEKSVQELISVLDFRAAMILSDLAKEKGDVFIVKSSDLAKKIMNEPDRDMEVRPYAVKIDDVAGVFADLHEKNKKALIERQFVLAHEITRQIQGLLSEITNALSSARAGRDKALAQFTDVHISYFMSFPEPWTYASEYPGPLPSSLKKSPNRVVLMWKRDEEERIRVEAEQRSRAEHTARARELEGQLRKTESEKQRKIVETLQQAAREKGILREGDRCPQCGFRYAWDGTKCHHCRYRRK
jgi:CHAT domain